MPLAFSKQVKLVTSSFPEPFSLTIATSYQTRYATLNQGEVTKWKIILFRRGEDGGRAAGGGQPALGELLKKGTAFSKLNIIKWTKADVQIC